MKLKFQNERGGFMHLFLAASIFGTVAMTSLYGESLNDLIDGKSMPKRVSTLGSQTASCEANTVDTIIGTIGCGSTRKGAHLSSVTFLSAATRD